MEKQADSLSPYFAIPRIREVSPQRPLDWLARGWGDMRDNQGTSVCYGIFFALAGYLLLVFAAPRPYLFSTAVSGFLLIGPLAAAGLYEISRRHERAERTSIRTSMAGLRQQPSVLFHFSILLALNPVPMLVWAALIVVLVVVGFASLMVGMVIMLPLLGHATWRAYRDLVG